MAWLCSSCTGFQCGMQSVLPRALSFRLKTHIYTHMLQSSFVVSSSLGPLASYLAANGAAILAFTSLSLMQTHWHHTETRAQWETQLFITVSPLTHCRYPIWCLRRSFSGSCMCSFVSDRSKSTTAADKYLLVILIDVWESD